MSNKRLSLEAFKAKAENVKTDEVLEKVQGGSWSDCHGFWGSFNKALSSVYGPDSYGTHM